jgi:putative transposase
MWYFKKRDRGDQWLRIRMKEIASVRVRYGFERILVMLRREGFKGYHKRVYRVYREEGLNPSKQTFATLAQWCTSPRASGYSSNQSGMEHGLSKRCPVQWAAISHLAIVDNNSKKCLLVFVGKSLRGEDVRNELS